MQAANGKIPELKRVIVSDGQVVRMAENMGLAFVALFGSRLLEDANLQELATYAGEIPVDQLLTESGEVATSPDAGGLPQTVEALVAQANEHFAQAQALAGQGDWGGYGREIDALRATLDQLAAAVGAVAPENAPAADATPEPAP